jgi:hypothetical protein
MNFGHVVCNVMLNSLVCGTNVSEGTVSNILRYIETFLRMADNHLQDYGVTTRKTTIAIFTASYHRLPSLPLVPCKVRCKECYDSYLAMEIKNDTGNALRTNNKHFEVIQ